MVPTYDGQTYDFFTFLWWESVKHSVEIVL